MDSEDRGPPLEMVVMMDDGQEKFCCTAEGHRLTLGPRLTKNNFIGTKCHAMPLTFISFSRQV